MRLVFIGILIACALFGVVPIIIMNLVNKNNIDDYKKLVNNNEWIILVMEVFSFVPSKTIPIIINGTNIEFIFSIPLNFIKSINAQTTPANIEQI